MKRLRPAFVVTSCLVTLACSSSSQSPKTAEEGLSHNPPAPTLRKREGKLTLSDDKTAAGLDAPSMRLLHPRDAYGRITYVDDDNSCHVEVPKPGSMKVDVIPVDCPAIFDDPAWDDHRTGWVLRIDDDGRSCAFESTILEEPPEPIIAKCPAKSDLPKPP